MTEPIEAPREESGTRDIVELLALHELAMKTLYETFAEQFPKHREMWTSIAAQEQGHADALMAFHAANEFTAHAAFSQLKPQAVLLSIEFVEQKTTLARAGVLSAVQALAVGRELESALIEGSFLKAGRAVPALAEVTQRLAAETREHLARIMSALEAERV